MEALRGTVALHFFGGDFDGAPGGGVGWSFGVNAEIPDVEVHAGFAEHFDDRVFAGVEVLGGDDFDPASG